MTPSYPTSFPPKTFRRGVRLEWAYRFGLAHEFDHEGVRVAHTTPRGLLRKGDFSLETLLAWLGSTQVGWEALPRIAPKRSQVLIGVAYCSLDAPQVDGEDALTELLNSILTECEEVAFAYALLADPELSRVWRDRIRSRNRDAGTPAIFRDRLSQRIDQLLGPIQEAYRQMAVCETRKSRTDLLGLKFASGESIVDRLWQRRKLRDPRIIDWLRAWFAPKLEDF